MRSFLRTLHHRVRAGILILSLLLAGSVTACRPAVSQENYQSAIYKYYGPLDTDHMIQLYLKPDQDRDHYETLLEERLWYYHYLFDAYHSYHNINNVYTLNENAGIQPIKVDDPLFDLIQFCLEQRQNTLDRTNIAFGSVTRIWKQFLSDPSIGVPAPDTLQVAGQHIDMDQIQLDKAAQTVYLADPQMRLDVGAVAKGYVAELLADELQASGVESAMIYLGGNVKILGERKNDPSRTFFTSSIQDPNNPQEIQGVGLTIRLDDQAAFVTSGNYQRFVMVDDVFYHHLIDPDTLQPAPRYRSVTILAPDSGVADYLSTALFTVDMDTAREILSHYPGVEVFWITTDNQYYWTNDFAKYVVNVDLNSLQ